MAASFRLARLLRLQAQVRRLRQHEADALAATLSTLRREERALAAARERALGGEGAGMPIAAEAFHLARVYDAALAERERRCATEVRATQAALAAKREELARERREERKFRRLEETHRQRVAEEETRRTDRLLDELALDAHARERRGRDDGGR